MAKKLENKWHVVYLDMRYSHEIRVKAPNKWVAKAKVFAAFVKKLKTSDFNIYVDLE